MGTMENKKLVHRMFTELGRGSIQGLVDCLAEDVEWTVVGKAMCGACGTLRGKQEVAEKLIGLAAETAGPVEPIPRTTIAEGDHVAVHGTATATTRTGAQYESVFCIISRVSGGKVQSVMEWSVGTGMPADV